MIPFAHVGKLTDYRIYHFDDQNILSLIYIEAMCFGN